MQGWLLTDLDEYAKCVSATCFFFPLFLSMEKKTNIKIKTLIL